MCIFMPACPRFAPSHRRRSSDITRACPLFSAATAAAFGKSFWVPCVSFLVCKLEWTRSRLERGVGGPAGVSSGARRQRRGGAAASTTPSRPSNAACSAVRRAPCASQSPAEPAALPSKSAVRVLSPAARQLLRRPLGDHRPSQWTGERPAACAVCRRRLNSKPPALFLLPPAAAASPAQRFGQCGSRCPAVKPAARGSCRPSRRRCRPRLPSAGAPGLRA